MTVRTRAVLTAGLGLAAILPAVAGVITGSNVTFAKETFMRAEEYHFTLLQNEAGTDVTGFWLNFDGAALSFASINLDEGSAWFLTTYNEAFTAQTIEDGNHPVLFSWRADPMTNNLPVAPGPFYLGIQTWHGAGEVYGWALMDHAGSELVMLDNAMAYGAEGIYIGTTNAIPEPSTLALLGAGGLAIHATRRVRRRESPRFS